jgi:hypothetical protein
MAQQLASTPPEEGAGGEGADGEGADGEGAGGEENSA